MSTYDDVMDVVDILKMHESLTCNYCSNIFEEYEFLRERGRSVTCSNWHSIRPPTSLSTIELVMHPIKELQAKTKNRHK